LKLLFFHQVKFWVENTLLHVDQFHQLNLNEARCQHNENWETLPLSDRLAIPGLAISFPEIFSITCTNKCESHGISPSPSAWPYRSRDILISSSIERSHHFLTQ
jgi:hypothetical protein